MEFLRKTAAVLLLAGLVQLGWTGVATLGTAAAAQGTSGAQALSEGRVLIGLELPQAVPYRAFALDGPDRFVIDLAIAALDGIEPAQFERVAEVISIRAGPYRPGWARIVLELARPMALETASVGIAADTGAARLEIALRPRAETEAPRPPPPAAGLLAVPDIALGPRVPRKMGDRLVVALDAGHGGLDPGARASGVDEKDLMLGFARRVKEVLLLSGRYEVAMIRDEDVFVPLDERITRARAAGAQIFISLHADALKEGTAAGTTIYTLSAAGTDAASEELAARHDRGDLLSGVDFSGRDDAVASVLMDLARVETVPRSQALADALVDGIAASVGKQRKRPRLEAAFTVLKASDIPSVLIEVGFMSNPADLANLQNPAWNEQVANGILAALDAWSFDDAARSGLLRK